MNSLMEMAGTMIHRCCPEYYTPAFPNYHIPAWEIFIFNDFQKFLTLNCFPEPEPDDKKFTVLIFEKIELCLTFFEDNIQII